MPFLIVTGIGILFALVLGEVFTRDWRQRRAILSHGRS